MDTIDTTLAVRVGKKLTVAPGTAHERSNMGVSGAVAYLNELGWTQGAPIPLTFISGSDTSSEVVLNLAEALGLTINGNSLTAPTATDAATDAATVRAARTNRKLNLGINLVFNNSLEARDAVRFLWTAAKTLAPQPIDPIKLTRNFFRGSFEGRVRSLFDEFLAGGDPTSRLRVVFDSSTSADDAYRLVALDPEIAEMARAIRANKTPEEFSPTGSVSMTYFKLWVLFTTVA